LLKKNKKKVANYEKKFILSGEGKRLV